jgi:hypothetical protein
MSDQPKPASEISEDTKKSVQELRKSLWKTYQWATGKMELYVEDDKMRSKLGDLQQKLAKSLEGCMNLEQRLGLLDEDALNRHITGLFLKLEEYDARKKAEEGKKTLMTIKKYVDRALKSYRK